MNINLRHIILALALVFLGGTTATAQGAPGVELLEGFGGTVQAGQPIAFATYVRAAYTFAIQAAGVIAVVQLVFAGIQYIYLGFSEANVSKAKSRATNAIYGLLAVLFTYFIVNLINPNLISRDFSQIIVPLKESEINTQPKNPPPQSSGGSTAPSAGSFESRGTAGLSRSNNDATLLAQNCPTCVDVSRLVPDLDFHGNSRKNLEKVTAAKVGLLANRYGTEGWIVTEAFPPTRNGVTDINRHRHDCHKVGTCLDVQLTGNLLDGQKINSFATEASRSGFYPVYEVRTETERRKIVDSGYEGCIIVIPGEHIGGPHFSLYNQRQKSC